MQTLVEIKKQLEAVQKSFDRNHSLLIEFDKEFHKSCKILASRPCKPFSYDFFLPYQNPDFKKGTLAAINHYINAYINYFSVITRFFTEIYFPLKKELDQINEVIESMEIAVKKFDQVAFTRSDEVFFEPKRAANVISTQINNFKETRDLLSSQF